MTIKLLNNQVLTERTSEKVRLKEIVKNHIKILINTK